MELIRKSTKCRSYYKRGFFFASLALPRLGELRRNALRSKSQKTEQWNSFVKVQSVGAITKGDSFSQVSLPRVSANFA
ncbi:hypothetical protein DLM78_09955 [Leptospira stimsonii]|uniref:Uncharacterized protein n=1 Tax=Leptospira stimsonii TaxID=2202203 RepID=A0A8B3CSI9_9LEPT|nr:hypothetical protein DLM78_09955 [Leptospira stimsonii]